MFLISLERREEGARNASGESLAAGGLAQRDWWLRGCLDIRHDPGPLRAKVQGRMRSVRVLVGKEKEALRAHPHLYGQVQKTLSKKVEEMHDCIGSLPSLNIAFSLQALTVWHAKAEYHRSKMLVG